METGTALAFISFPYVVLSLAYLWPFHLRTRVSSLLRLGRGILVLGTCAMAAGDVLLGTERFTGVAPVFLGTGVFTVAALLLLAFSATARTVATSGVRQALDVIREDFAEPSPGATRRSTVLSVVLFLVFVVTFYLLYHTYGAFNYQLKFFVFDYLDLVREWAGRVPLWSAVVGEECVNTRVWDPFTFALYGFIERLNPWSYVHVCLSVVLGIFAIQWFLNRSRSPWLLFLSHAFYLAVSLNPDYEYNRTGYFELVFALLFLANFLAVLHVRLTVPWFLALGLLTGLAFCQKELNIINVILISFRLATSDLPRRRLVALLAAVAAGFTAPAIFLFVFFLRCGVTEGLYHVPFLWFRGVSLQTVMTQTDVKSLIEIGEVFPLVEMFLRRMSFQTVGEVVIGSASRLGLYAFTGVFPVLWMYANFPRARMRIVGVYLLVGFFLYGLTRWKGGDSSEPLYTMLPFGYVFAAPYLVRLAGGAFAMIRSRTRPSLRSLYLLILVILNTWFIGQQVGPVLRTLRDARHLSGFSGPGLTYAVEPSPGEAGLRDMLFRLREDGELGPWLFLGACWPSEVPRSIVHSDLDRHLVLLDVRFEVLDAIRRADFDRLRQVFRVMVYQYWYHPPSRGKIWVLACMHEGRPSRTGMPFGTVGPLLGGCVEVRFTDPSGLGMVLFSFDLERCARYLPEDLLDPSRPTWGRTPDLPLLPPQDPGPRR